MTLRPLLAAAVLAIAAIAVPTASAACAYTASPVFQAWGDSAPYAPVQGASFESGSSGWNWWNRSRLITGDDSPLFGGGSHALEVGGGSGARSPWICVDETTPSLRFFLRRVGGNGNLRIFAIPADGGQPDLIATLTADRSWQPSDIVMFPESFTGETTVQLVFVSDPYTIYRIDDVFIDPFKCC